MSEIARAWTKTLIIIAALLFASLPAAVRTARCELLPRKPIPYVFSLPFKPGTIVQVGYAYDSWPTHEGLYAIDWIADEGTPILAARGGTVVQVVDDCAAGGLEEKYRLLGNRVVIRHDDSSYALYLHNRKGSARVKAGERVREGEEIAEVGNTGYSSTPHLHFMAYRMEGKKQASYPVFFHTTAAQPEEMVAEAKYTVPGGSAPTAPQPPEGGSELSSAGERIKKLILAAPDNASAAQAFLKFMQRDAGRLRNQWLDICRRAMAPDRRAQRELAFVMDNVMGIDTTPEVAKIKTDPKSADAATQALIIWWQIFAPAQQAAQPQGGDAPAKIPGD